MTEDGLLRIKGWARDGFTDEQIAHCMNIRRETLWEWQKRYPNMANTIKEGRAPVAIKIEDAFYSRCNWREVEEVKEEIFRDSNGRETRKKTITKRMIPPDTAVLIFALKNLRPDKWRDKPVEVENNTAEADAFNKLLAVIGKHDAD